jgi:hypothetical protein
MEAQPHTHQNKWIAQADFQSTKKLEAFPNFFLINLAYLINTPLGFIMINTDYHLDFGMLH